MNKFIKKYNLIIFDFDGVIKNSLEVKSKAFERLFESYGKLITKKIKSHHKKNEGLSRYKKIPIYLSWVNEDLSKKNVNKFCNRYSKLVFYQVIKSTWVPGIKVFLRKNPYKQIFSIVTATPEKEIIKIVLNLNIRKHFKIIKGSPTSKSKLIKIILKKYKINPNKALMIGDTLTDYVAAKTNKVEFIFRKTDYNSMIIKKYNKKFIRNFYNFV